MKLFRFIISSVFFKNIFYIICFTLIVAFTIFFGLGFVTQHNNYVKVPELFPFFTSKRDIFNFRFIDFVLVDKIAK